MMKTLAEKNQQIKRRNKWKLSLMTSEKNGRSASVKRPIIEKDDGDGEV